MMKKNRNNQKLESKIVELISSEELTSLANLITSIERKENILKRKKEKEKHNAAK